MSRLVTCFERRQTTAGLFPTLKGVGPSALVRFHTDNLGMEISGTVRDGVVIPEEGVSLPEGAVVRVVLADGATEMGDAKVKLTFASGRKRVKFPLVESNAPGSVHLTNKRIAEIFDEEDAVDD